MPRALLYRYALLALLPATLTACGDKDDEDADEASLSVDGAYASGDLTAEFVDGLTYNDSSDGGALVLLLTDFDVDCSMAAEIMFEVPSGGIYVNLETADGRGTLMVHDGAYQVNGEDFFDFAADLDEGEDTTSGSVTFDGDRGGADFTVEHCGDVNPWG